MTAAAARSSGGRAPPRAMSWWRAAGRSAFEELIREVGDGLYIGRIWYTYPINGLRAGDFTCTVVGDSFVIRDGRIAAPIRANAIRINDNITRVLTERRRRHEGRQGHDGVGGRRGRVRAGARGERGARGRDRRRFMEGCD